jgi:FtsP/CotA-like multicopper oxidase with cupredoxin domain
MSMKSDKTLVNNAASFFNEVRQAKLTRRELLKLGVCSGAGALAGLNIPRLNAQVAAASLPPPSPYTTPWLEPLPIPQVVSSLSPDALTSPELGGVAPNPAAHQYYNLFPAQKFHYMQAKQSLHSFSPDLPPSTIWGFAEAGQEAAFAGTVVHARYGEPVLLRIANQLPSRATHTGFGMPQLITHLHNFHAATESDGGPWDWYDPGGFKDHHYTMARAGFSVPDTIPAQYRDASGGDVRETLTTLFFHYHRPDFTGAGVYKGVVGMYLCFDEQDTGDETTGWRLPSGEHDIPLVIADKRFSPSTGALTFDQFNTDGFLGDKFTVNGKIQPFLQVKRRKYRLRLLNSGPARFYQFVLYKDGVQYPFTQITDNGNFLQKPRNLKTMQLWPAERSDIIIDFTQFNPGDVVYLANILKQTDGRQPAGATLNPGNVNNQLLRIEVGADAIDPSVIPAAFRPFPAVNLAEAVRTRTFRFTRTNGMWAINDRLWDPRVDHSAARLANPLNQVKRNTAEIWRLVNSSGGWSHPVHIHFEEAQILKVNGKVVPAGQKARVDMYRLGPNTTVEMFMRFRDFPDPNWSPASPKGLRGRYVMHCHNLQHEDHAMMATWNIVP